MIRILRVIARMNVGGPAMHVALLHERLDPARYASTLVSGAEEASEGNWLDLHGRRLDNLVVVPELGRELRGGRDLTALLALVRVVRATRPHILETHTAKAGTIGRLAARLCRVPAVIHTYHGHVLRGYFSPAKSRVFTAVERVLARVTDRLVAVSARVRDELLEAGVGRAEQYAVVPLGLDLSPYAHPERHRGELRRELGLAPGTPLVGIVARLAPVKAHEVFLEAARLLAAARPDVGFVVVGDGERRRELEAASVGLGIDARCHFLGWRADLDRIYADLDVVALTSRNEGSPVALIEAMAAGCAVVATRVGGVPDVVGDNETGLLVPAGDAPALARAVGDLLDSAGRRGALGNRARGHVLAAHGAERLLADMDALYAGLLETKRRAHA